VTRRNALPVILRITRRLTSRNTFLKAILKRINDIEKF